MAGMAWRPCRRARCVDQLIADYDRIRDAIEGVFPDFKLQRADPGPRRVPPAAAADRRNGPPRPARPNS